MRIIGSLVCIQIATSSPCLGEVAASLRSSLAMVERTDKDKEVVDDQGIAFDTPWLALRFEEQIRSTYVASEVVFDSGGISSDSTGVVGFRNKGLEISSGLISIVQGGFQSLEDGEDVITPGFNELVAGTSGVQPGAQLGWSHKFGKSTKLAMTIQGFNDHVIGEDDREASWNTTPHPTVAAQVLGTYRRYEVMIQAGGADNNHIRWGSFGLSWQSKNASFNMEYLYKNSGSRFVTESTVAELVEDAHVVNVAGSVNIKKATIIPRVSWLNVNQDDSRHYSRERDYNRFDESTGDPSFDDNGIDLSVQTRYSIGSGTYFYTLIQMIQGSWRDTRNDWNESTDPLTITMKRVEFGLVLKGQ